MIGIGNPNAQLIVYNANRPPLDEFKLLTNIRGLKQGEIRLIGELTGNHWRKIFNCFAKLIFELQPKHFKTWQTLRDNELLTDSGEELLLFSKPNIHAARTGSNATSPIHIISGKTYFSQLSLNIKVEWLDDFFAINSQYKLIVSPYFDYRQLSNIKITQLVSLINNLRK